MGIPEQRIFYGVAPQLSPVTPKYDSNSNTILELLGAMLRKTHLLWLCALSLCKHFQTIGKIVVRLKRAELFTQRNRVIP